MESSKSLEAGVYEKAKKDTKKDAKKARRAAKVQERVENENEQDTSTPISKESPEANASEPVSPELDKSQTANSKKDDKKARRAAKVQQKENSETTNPETAIADGKEAPVPPATPQSEKKPALSKAERRAIQEAQRQAKEEKKKQEAQKKEQTANTTSKSKDEKSATKRDDQHEKAASGKTTHKSKEKKHGTTASSVDVINVPRALSQIGLQFADDSLNGTSSQSAAILYALRQQMIDKEECEDGDWSKAAENLIKQTVEYLSSCKNLSASQMNIIKYMKMYVQGCRIENCVNQIKEGFVEATDRFYDDRIYQSHAEIAKKTVERIEDADVIITYGYSSLVFNILLEASKSKSNLHVIVVDSGHRFEGRELLRMLAAACPDVTCTYVLIHALSYVMPKANKVLLCAHAILANGHVKAKIGSSQIALMAKAYNVPVLVCCETYKFSDKMQTDATMSDVTCDPEVIKKMPSLTSAHELIGKTLQISNPLFDITPPEYVGGLITEAGVIPCTSAPAVIRVKQQYEVMQTKI